MLGPEQLSCYSSTGFARRVRGGRFPSASREAAAKATHGFAGAAAVDLVYELRPESLGHIHRAPCVLLPPNRIATSKKWARLAAHAGMGMQ